MSRQDFKLLFLLICNSVFGASSGQEIEINASKEEGIVTGKPSPGWRVDYNRNMCVVKLDRLIAIYGEDQELGFNDTAISIVIGKMRRLMFNPYAWRFGFDYDDLMLQVQVSQPLTDKKMLSNYVFKASEGEYRMTQYLRGDDEFDKYHGIYFLLAGQAESVFNALKANGSVIFEFDSPASGKVKVPIKAQGLNIAVKMYEACLGV